MNMLKNMLITLSTVCALVFLTGGGCGGDSKAKRNDVSTCAGLDETECDKSKVKGGNHCFWTDSASGNGGVCQEAKPGIGPATNCAALAKDMCMDSGNCVYDFTANGCVDADTKTGTCEAFQKKDSCEKYNQCKWTEDQTIAHVGGKCESKGGGGGPNAKKVSVFEIAALAGANGLAHDNLKGIAASFNGTYLYELGLASLQADNDNVIRAKEITEPDWTPICAAAETASIKNIKTGAGDIDIGNVAVVDKWTSLYNGLAVMTDTDGIRAYIQIEGKGGHGAGVAGVLQGAFGLADKAAQAFGSIKKGNDTFVYLDNDNQIKLLKALPLVLTAITGTYVGATDIVDNFGNFTDITGVKEYKQFFADKDGNLMMLNTSGHRLDRVSSASVGTATDTRESNEFTASVARYDASWLQDSATPNAAKVCESVGDYLVCGFEAGDNTGGIAVHKYGQGNIADGTGWTFLTKANTWSNIAPSLHGDKKGKQAVITGPKGIVVFEDGKLLANGTIINPDTVKADAASGIPGVAGTGFAADIKVSKYLNAAQDSTGLWYVAIEGSGPTTGGIYTLKVREEDVQ